MEAGQLLHNNPIGLDCPEFVCAMMVHIRSELACIYWNINQKPWAGAAPGDIGGSDDYWSKEEKQWEPLPPGIEFRPYYNWGGSPEDSNWDQDQANKPNFSFEGVEIRWYKRFGRSMNVNVCWPPDKWVRWFERCM